MKKKKKYTIVSSFSLIKDEELEENQSLGMWIKLVGGQSIWCPGVVITKNCQENPVCLHRG